MKFNFELLVEMLAKAPPYHKISTYEKFLEGLMQELRQEPPIVWIDGVAYIKLNELLKHEGAS